MSVPLQQRIPATSCAKCRRPFGPGDRAMMVFIVQKAGLNPRNPREMGVMVGEEFEMAHAQCDDPRLDGTIVLGPR